MPRAGRRFCSSWIKSTWAPSPKGGLGRGGVSRGGLGQGDLGGSEACTLACHPPGTVGVASTLAAAGAGAGGEGWGFTLEAQDREPAHVDGALITPYPYTGLRVFNCSLLSSCANMRRLRSTGSPPCFTAASKPLSL